jgi:hypothetical protein
LFAQKIGFLNFSLLLLYKQSKLRWKLSLPIENMWWIIDFVPSFKAWSQKDL